MNMNTRSHRQQNNTTDFNVNHYIKRGLDPCTSAHTTSTLLRAHEARVAAADMLEMVFTFDKLCIT